MDDPGTRDIGELLRGLRLIRDGAPLNAAIVLFGRGEARLPDYPQCVLRMARFRGADKREFIDNRQVYGNAFDLLIRAQRFLRDHLPIAGRVLPDVFARRDDPLYPPAALREALANALCHRDYGSGGGGVNLAIYDDQLEITSAGGLPFGLTAEELLLPHTSRLWNPLIAEVFYRRGIIEAWGSGTLKMADPNRAAGLTPPEFEARPGEVTVRFRPSRATPSRIERPDLTPLQRELLDILAGASPISLPEIQRHLSTLASLRTAQRALAALRALELAGLRGRGQEARWSLGKQSE